tara:strand:- start:99 stop:389 length:291 start_codon:yes stop_codon:yes gene_type:complete
MSNDDNISVIINNLEYKIKCGESEIDLLNRSAALLDIKISEIKKASPTITNDKAAVMAGLNIASMYLDKNDKSEDLESVSDELEIIQNTLKFEGDT